MHPLTPAAKALNICEIFTLKLQSLPSLIGDSPMVD